MNKFDAKKEKKKLQKIAEKLTSSRTGPAYERMITDASFMAEQLQKLQEAIAVAGWTERYEHGGGQSGNKQSAAGNAYLALSKQYRETMRMLMEAVADAEKASSGPVQSNPLLDLLAKYRQESEEARKPDIYNGSEEDEDGD